MEAPHNTDCVPHPTRMLCLLSQKNHIFQALVLCAKEGQTEPLFPNCLVTISKEDGGRAPFSVWQAEGLSRLISQRK